MEIPSQYYNVNRTIQGNVTMHMTHSVNLHSWKNTAVTRGHFSAWIEHRTESRIPLLRGFLCGCCGCFWSQRCIWVSSQCAKSFRRLAQFVAIWPNNQERKHYCLWEPGKGAQIHPCLFGRPGTCSLH